GLVGVPDAQRDRDALGVEPAARKPGGLGAIQNLPKQQEVAIMINTSRETVSRAIAHLVAIGVLEKDYRRLIVRDLQRLRRMATQQMPMGGVAAAGPFRSGLQEPH